MHNEMDKFLKEHVGSNTVQISGKVPEKLAYALKQKAAELNIDVSTLTRAALSIFIMPELLEKLTQDETTNWISKEGSDKIQYHFGEKYKKYKAIIDFAEFATEKTKELCEQFSQAEVDYMNKISERKFKRSIKN